MDENNNKLLNEKTFKVIEKGTGIFFFLKYKLLLIIAFLCFLITFGVTGMQIKERIKTKDYIKTKGELVDYNEGVDSFSGTYSGVYEYEVDGKTYTYIHNEYMAEKDVKKRIKIYYNPNDPSVAISYMSFMFLPLIVGIVCIALYIFLNRLRKRKVNEVLNVMKDKMIENNQ